MTEESKKVTSKKTKKKKKIDKYARTGFVRATKPSS